MQNYAEMIKKSGLKATFQRMTILSVIDKFGHVSIDEIYEEVKKTHPTLSLATVYKNILNMVSHNVLIEVPIAGQKSRYELKKPDHIHLICTNCDLMVDLDPNLAIQSTLAEIAQREDFKVSSTQINIYGICSKCSLKDVS
jgi:Fur family ferric uptake transcriptional regulator/Fur family peroxide stress response transcriptional regulator